MDKDDLIKAMMSAGDEDAKAVWGEKTRAAIAVTTRPQADLFGFRQPGLGPVDHGAMGANFSFQPPVKAEQTRFNLGPAQKNVPAAYAAPDIQISEMPMEADELEMPQVLNQFSLFDDDEFASTNQEMLCEEPLEDGAMPLLEEFDFGCKTSLVTSHEPGQVLQALRTAIVILESSGSEITHEDEGWQMRVEYISKSSHASVSINLLETNNKEVAISFTRTSGHGWVFQSFYRQCVAQLRNVLSDVRAMDGEALPTTGTIENEFDVSGLEVSGDAIRSSLSQYIDSMNQRANKGELEPKREATGGIVQLISNYPEKCLSFAKDPKFCQNMTQLMREFSSDPEVMRNCVRAFNILMESQGSYDEKVRMYQLLHVTPAFAIVANCIREALSGKESAAAVTMVCKDLCKFLGHIVENYYTQGARPSSDAVDALRGVVDQKCHQLHQTFHDQCNKFLVAIR